jgi:2,3-bisphosphoglycerate-dependent phosphoglycerate mutase
MNALLNNDLAPQTAHSAQNTAESCQIWFIRHGETDWNAAHRMQGRTDIALNAVGLAQAGALAPFIARAHAQTPFTAVYATPLIRARQTAIPLAAALNLPAADIRINADLQERAFGIIEGEPYDTVRSGTGRTPALTAVAQQLFARDPDYLPPDGETGAAETLRQFYTRVVRGASTIAAAHPNGRVAVVVHGGVLDCLWRWAHHIDLKPHRTWSTVNASVNVFRVAGQAAQVLAWGVQAGDGTVPLDDAVV